MARSVGNNRRQGSAAFPDVSSWRRLGSSCSGDGRHSANLIAQRFQSIDETRNIDLTDACRVQSQTPGVSARSKR